jgi:hypothetical protein
MIFGKLHILNKCYTRKNDITKYFYYQIRYNRIPHKSINQLVFKFTFY